MKSASRADQKFEEKYRDRIKMWKEEYKEKVEGVDDDDEEDVAAEGEEDELDGLGNEDDAGKGENSSDEEFKADEDFINADDIIVKHEQLEQVLKGYRVELIGGEDALGIDKQNSLERRVDIDEEDSDEDGAAAEGKPVNFFAKQKAEMQRQENLRDDKHLLPATIKQ